MNTVYISMEILEGGRLRSRLKMMEKEQLYISDT